jgi:hypothetical protein
MAEQETTTPAPARRDWAESLTQLAKPAAYVLILLAIAVGGLAIWLGVTYKMPLWPLWAYAGLVAVCFLIGGVWLLAYPVTQEGGKEAVRLFVLSLGGTIGLLTVVLGIKLGKDWWSDILVLTQAGGPDPNLVGNERTLAILRAVLPLPVLILGMAIAFCSLLIARTDERTSAFLRRLLYGYNAVVQGLLAILIIVVANVFVAMKFNKPLDFTSASFYTLSPKSETLLQSLDKPVHLIVFLDPRDPLYNMLQSMLANCRAVTDKIDVEYLSNNPADNPARFDEIAKKYPDIIGLDGTPRDDGILVVYGDTSGAKGDYKLIKKADLISVDFRGGDGRSFEFRGEDALMTELDFYSTGRKKTVVYFTQGNDELDIKDNSLFNRAAMQRGQRVADINRGSGILKDRLEKRNMEVKALDLSRIKPEVPPDANIVAILGPRKRFSEAAVKALDEYMARKGKLLIMVGPEVGAGSTMQPTGLETFLSRYGVDFPNEIIYTANSRDPFLVLARPNRRFENNPLVSKFLLSKPFVMRPARPVRSQPSGPPGMSPFTTEAVLVADRELYPWAESDLSLTVEQLKRAMSRNEELAERKLGPGQQNPIPLAVAVSEGPPFNPHMGMMAPPPSGEQTPRLVVFGSVTMASNARVTEEVDSSDFDYLAGCFDWLRGKNNSIGIGPKKSSVFGLSPSLKQSGNFWAFVLLPTMIICLGIIGTGTGVWLVRRR